MYKKISSRVVGSDTTALTGAQTRPVLPTRLVLIKTDSSVSLKHSHNIRSRGDDVWEGEGEGRGSVLHLGCGTIFGGRGVRSGAICRTLFASALPDDWHHDDATRSVGAKHAHAPRLHFLGNAARLSARTTRFCSVKET